MTQFEELKRNGIDFWEEKKKEYERALDFFEQVKAGDTVKIEKYAFPMFSPYSIEKYADKRDRKVVKIYAMNQNGLWFTTDKGEAIDAKAVIKWEVIPQQLSLF